MANDIGGVWRTIGGRRVFIKEGQSLASAMKASGKFNNKKDIEHQQRKINNDISRNMFNKKEQAEKEKEYDAYEELKKTEKANEPIEKRLEKQNRYTESESIKEVKDKYMPERTKAVSQYQNGEIDRNELMKRFDGNEQRMKETFEQMGYTAPTKENIDKANKRHEEFMKNLKGKDNDDYEYNLYKQAKENPDSINPMTEMSTDWEDLDKRFKDRYEKENQKSDLMTAEQLKGKDREEQKEINKQYLKEQNKLVREKNKEDDNQFTMYNSQYDKEVTVKKGADGKWVDSDGNKYMGYLSKQDVKQYFKGNWKESTEKRTASEIISSQMSKTKNAKVEVANALGLKYDNDNEWKSTSQLYKEQKGKDIANIAIDSSKADKYNAFVKKNYNHDDKNFSDRADIDKYAKDNNLDADALYYMTKIASESDRTKLKKKAFELYKKQHPNTKKTIYSFEDDIK